MSCDKSRIIAITICALMLFATACTGVKRTEPEPQAPAPVPQQQEKPPIPQVLGGTTRMETRLRVYIKSEF